MQPNVYIKDGNVYAGTRQLTIKEQRGKRYVHFQGKQVNVKSLPEIQPETDCVFEYIFNGGFRAYPCPAMAYWIYRHRLKNKISTKDYAAKFKVKKHYFTK